MIENLGHMHMIENLGHMHMIGNLRHMHPIWKSCTHGLLTSIWFVQMISNRLLICTKTSDNNPIICVLATCRQAILTSASHQSRLLVCRWIGHRLLPVLSYRKCIQLQRPRKLRNKNGRHLLVLRVQTLYVFRCLRHGPQLRDHVTASPAWTTTARGDAGNTTNNMNGWFRFAKRGSFRNYVGYAQMESYWCVKGNQEGCGQAEAGDWDYKGGERDTMISSLTNLPKA